MSTASTPLLRSPPHARPPSAPTATTTSALPGTIRTASKATDYNPRKRQRTACDRCKGRKQRCDNAYPHCSNCVKAGLECRKPPESEALRVSSAYTRALEEKIAVLEWRLAGVGRERLGRETAGASPGEQQQQQQQQQQQRSPRVRHRHQHQHRHQRQQEPVAAESPGPRAHNVADIVGLLSLGDAAAPAYIGSSSGYALASNLGEMVQATIWNKALWIPGQAVSGAGTAGDAHFHNTHRREDKDGSSPLKPTLLASRPQRRITISELRSDTTEVPSDALGTRLIEAYLTRIHPRFPFLVRADIWAFHRKRHVLGSAQNSQQRQQQSQQQTPRSKEDSFALFVLYMVYAIGALNLRLTEAYTDIAPEKLYVSALQHVSGARDASQLHNLEAMVLLILYHLRSESHHGLWHMSGLAMRTVTDLGLQREASTRHLPPLTAQLRRRLFWSVYALEGVLASTLGRPVSLADSDIDQPLPLSVDDSGTSGEAAVATAMANGPPAQGKEAYPYTNLTQSILLFQLRRFETRVQRSIYRVDKPTSALLPKLAPLYAELSAWYASIPPEVRDAELDRPLLNYHKTVRLLIQPFLTMLGPTDPYFLACLSSAGQICQVHKRLHQSPEYGHSFIAVHTVFVAGLTMLYCLWLGRDKVWSVGVSNNVRACSCVLSIMGERAPWVRRYRDIFESLVEATMTTLEGDGTRSEAEAKDGQAAWMGLSDWPDLDGLDVLDDGAWSMAKELAGWIGG